MAVLEVDQPALVVGSSQPDADVDTGACARAGVALVRRRTGGGAVLLEPEAVLWVDVVIPAGDPLWDDDVGRAFLWLGRAWAGALADVAPHPVPDLGGGGWRVHQGGLVAGPLGRRVCFAGRGPGEVLDGGGRKAVGMAQRRTRAGALFQCAVPRRWDPDALVGLLRWPDARSRRAAKAELARSVVAVEVDPAALVGALVARLPEG